MSKSNFQLGGVSIGHSSHLPNFRQRILIVDDEIDIRRLNAEVLRCSGYEVELAEDGAAAWAMLEANNYDLLLTDNEMPELSGLELLEKIHAAGLILPAIMATGTIPSAEAGDRSRLQLEAILLKPYGIDELLDVVKNVLHASNSGQAEIWPPNWQRPSAALELQLR